MAIAGGGKSVSKKARDHLRKVADLLGGSRTLAHAITSSLDVHFLLVRGLPGCALHQLIDGLRVIDKANLLEKAIGMSSRAFEESKDVPAELLSKQQSGRTWKFAEILTKAIDVYGTQRAAEQWLERKAVRLDSRRPVDLLTTPVGVQLVEQYLERVTYGVYG
jgi:putative toxin-antitoxin system antitoxin component (TIGR02293 family)